MTKRNEGALKTIDHINRATLSHPLAPAINASPTQLSRVRDYLQLNDE